MSAKSPKPQPIDKRTQVQQKLASQDRRAQIRDGLIEETAIRAGTGRSSLFSSGYTGFPAMRTLFGG